MKPNVVIGAGIVGLAVAKALQQADPDRPVTVVEKEPTVAAHQSGHNSGVIHSGLYYPPGSLKARLAVRGARELKRFCAEHGVTADVPGKLVVATRRDELARLDALLARGLDNGVGVRRADAGEIAEREPHLQVLDGLVVESTGRVDFRDVAAALVAQIVERGGTIRCGVTVTSVSLDGTNPGPTNVSAADHWTATGSTAGSTAGSTTDGAVVVRTTDEVIGAHRVAVCAGLHADRLAVASGLDPGVRILPFRGEFSEIVPQRSHLVRGLVYPVPDPELPFLGVHLTRGIDGVVHIGPNAVPAMAREGYTWRDFSLRDVGNALGYTGSWRLARNYGRTGAREIARSLSGRSLVAAAQQMLPALRREDVRRSGSGVRAQAIGPDGRLVDDFLFVRQQGVLHVLNAPSPAATACLPIGEYIAAELLGR